MSSSRRCNVIESPLGLTLSLEDTVNLPLKFLYMAFYKNPERKIQISLTSIFMRCKVACSVVAIIHPTRT